MTSAIEIKQLTQVYPPDTTALKNISLYINAKQITGLIGPDGAGKTTLLRLMARLLKPTKGEIIMHFPQEASGDNFFDNLGYMPQKFGFYEDLTVQENLELFLKLRNVPEDQRDNAIKKTYEFTSLGAFKNRRVAQLSGGMKQKLGLSCVLLGEPSILLLDEPTVGVDPVSRIELWEIINQLKIEGMTIIWSTAYLDEAQKCDEVILLNEGKVLFNEDPNYLTKSIQHRTFLTPIGEKDPRVFITQTLQNPLVLDAIIEGDQLRLLLKDDPKAQAQMDKSLELERTPARFEDAFIDILKGNYIRESELAKRMTPRVLNETAPIEAKNLFKKFNSFTAVDNVSLTIKRGEIFGLLGPNGAGKSTIFKMLCGILTPTSGTVLIEGVNLQQHIEMSKQIGYMAQKFSLYGHLSVIQNLNFFSGIYGLTGKNRVDKIAEMIQIFGLTPYLNENADSLPFGYKQRLALACSLMHEPDILFLDEPTSGVDPLTRREFWVHIYGMVQKGITIMISTHFMDEAQYCDRIAIINQAKCIALDTPTGLMKSVRTADNPNPTLEDAFIALVSTHAGA